MTKPEARDALVSAMRRMQEAGLNRGTSGNASIRVAGGMLVTPSGVAPAELTPESMVFIDTEGRIEPGLRPSTEYRMHHAILARRPDATAIMHCHSRFATTLACLGRPIEPIHYMVLVAKSRRVPVAPFAPFGTQALALEVIQTMQQGNACLMAHHGQIALGASWQQALSLAEEVEEQAALTYLTAALGGAPMLTEAQLAASERQFAGYGQENGHHGR